MSEKSFKKSEFKRTIDLGKTERGQATDLIRVWRESSGEEKAISLGDINGGLIGDYVPYTGAVDDVDLGEKGLSTGYVKYDTTPTSTPTDQGTTYWDIDDNTLAVIMNGTVLKVGEDQYYPVKNQTGVLIPKGTAVRFAGTLGSSGRLLIAPFIADGSVPSTRFMGVTSEDIDNGADGKVMWFGRIRGINTNSFNEGDILYASTTTSGGFQTTIPTAPNNIVEVCAVINKSASNGIIFVRPSFITSVQAGAGLSLDSLNQIQLGNDGAGRIDYSDNSVFESGFRIKSNFISGTESSSTGLDFDSAELQFRASWEDSSTSDLFGAYYQFQASSIGSRIDLLKNINSQSQGLIFDTDNSIVLTDQINSKGLEYADDYSANWTDHSLVTKSWVIGQISGAGHNPVTIGSPANGLAINPTTQVLTIGLASTSTTGALSSTDWNTFNNKLNLTSPITGYTVGGNTAIANTDTILQAFGKVQGQINARLVSALLPTQIAFGGNTAGVAAGVDDMAYNSSTRVLTLGIGFGFTLNTSLAADRGLLINAQNSSPVYLTANHNPITSNLRQLGFKGSEIRFETGVSSGSTTTLRWLVTDSGSLQSQGSQSITTTLNGNLSLTPNGTGLVMIGSGTPTNLLDVNGTARIRTIANGVGNFLTTSATGVIQQRTAAETRADIGAVGGTIASGQVAFGTGVNTVGGSGSFVYDSVNRRIGIGTAPSFAFDVLNDSDHAIMRLRGGSANGQGSGLFFSQGASNTTLLAIGDGSTMVGGAVNNAMIFCNVASLNYSFTGTTRFQMTTGGSFSVGGISPTNTLDVNGTTRIRTIANGVGNFLTTSATGVIQQRTDAETRADIGAVGGTGVSGQVAFWNDTSSQTGSNNLFWDNATKLLSIDTVSSSAIKLQVLGSATFRPISTGAITIGTPDSQNGLVITAIGATNERFDIRRYPTRVSFLAHNAGTTPVEPNGFFLFNTGNFSIGIATDSGERLNVNGNVRIQSIANATGNFLTTSATGVIQQRTAAETRADIGAVGGTGVSGQVAFWNDTSSQAGDSGLLWDNTNKRLNIGGNNFNNSTVVVRQTGNATLSIRSETGSSSIFGTRPGSNTNLWGIGDSANITGDPLNESVTIFANENLRFFVQGSERIRITGNTIGVLTNSPTNTLDVNGTARIRSIANATGNFLTTSATGVIQQRTANQVILELLPTISGYNAAVNQVLRNNSGTLTWVNV